MELPTASPISPLRTAIFHVGTPPIQHAPLCALSSTTFESLRESNEHSFSPATSFESDFDLQIAQLITITFTSCAPYPCAVVVESTVHVVDRFTSDSSECKMLKY
ncbi:unnamed protein product [Anisakis simplex]|uniref:Uncharacterized protein n=1 Tax=Anisakis simplex TaxID=6269 RepID=A0A0M3K7U3_ANISI|nr:unnamed protein product [Anisakis simplex]